MKSASKVLAERLAARCSVDHGAVGGHWMEAGQCLFPETFVTCVVAERVAKSWLDMVDVLLNYTIT